MGGLRATYDVRLRLIGNIGRSRSFKVIEVGVKRKPVCDFLLVINANWHLITYVSELLQLIVQIWDTLRFCAPHPLFGGLRDNVRCSSWTHCKARSGLPISVN